MAPYEQCPLCNARAVEVAMDFPGYRKPQTFSIFSCSGCHASYCRPLSTDESVYELIYRNVREVSGYKRYAKYSKLVGYPFVRPLAYLAESDPVYWAVREALAKIAKSATARILEIGSGLGYTTYALSRAGYQATGFDVSREAVRAATLRFGNLYQSGDFDGFVNEARGTYDVVVMTELIEHIPDVVEFLAKTLTLLRPGGSLVLTTPNRSAYGDDVVWDTAPPPVHLWWFSEESIRRLGERIAAKVELLDFSGFNAQLFNPETAQLLSSSHPCGSVFEADGSLNTAYPDYHEPWIAAKDYLILAAHVVGLVRPLRRLRVKARRGPYTPSKRSYVLCAIVTT
jgi:SAM-dependent methyltransferase